MPISKIARISAGGDCPKNYSAIRNSRFNIPIFSNGVVNEGIYGFAEDCNKVEESRSVTIAARGTIGAAFIRMERYIPIIRLISIHPFDRGGDVWIYQMIRRMRFEKNGSVQQQLTVPEVSTFNIPYLDCVSLTIFEKYTTPIVNQIYSLKKEISKFQQLRDELLPLLMNGLVSVMPTEVNCDLSHD